MKERSSRDAAGEVLFTSYLQFHGEISKPKSDALSVMALLIRQLERRPIMPCALTKASRTDFLSCLFL